MPKECLTKKETEVYENIKHYIFINQYPPSIQEITDMCKIKSKASTHHYVSNLINKGYLEYGSSKSARTLRLVGYRCKFIKIE